MNALLNWHTIAQCNKVSLSMNHRKFSIANSFISVIILLCVMNLTVMTKNALDTKQESYYHGIHRNQEDKFMQNIIKYINDGKKLQTVGSAKHIYYNLKENKKKRPLKKLINFDVIDKNSFFHEINIKKPDINKEKESSAQLTNKTVTVDGIKHYSKKRQQKVNTIENEFRKLLQMKGVSYIYKRDKQWRTWRKVNNSNGETSIVCYRCESISNNCTSCGESGFWVIEETLPPCLYEFFSMINEYEMCGINYNQLGHDSEELVSCPSVIKIFDLTATCDNPIVTKWRFKDFIYVGRNSSAICGAHERCEILTLYEILPEYSSFRIVNVKNEVMFSRIMKNGNQNFACVENCGIFDPTNMKVKPKHDKINPDKKNKNKQNTEIKQEKIDEKRIKVHDKHYKLKTIETLSVKNLEPNDKNTKVKPKYDNADNYDTKNKQNTEIKQERINEKHIKVHDKHYKLKTVETLSVKKLKPNEKKTPKSIKFNKTPHLVGKRTRNSLLHGHIGCKGKHCTHITEADESVNDFDSNSADIDYKDIRASYF